MTFVAVLAAIAAAVAAFLALRPKAVVLTPDDPLPAARREAAALVATATAESQRLLEHAQLEARGSAVDARAAAELAAQQLEDELSTRAVDAERRAFELERRAQGQEGRALTLGERQGTLKERDLVITQKRAETQDLAVALRRAIEQLAGETGDELKSRLVAEWLEEARQAAAERLRRVDASMNDPEHGRTAKRLLAIASQRYEGHYLTERLLTNVPIPPGAMPRIVGEGDEILRLIEEVAHVHLLPSENGESIRLDGQDSFGREIARRAISRFGKHGVKVADAKRTCEAIAQELDREVMDLGKRAFKELQIPRAHPDIVKLVGKLNYRTSYTQNQWKHAVEASFLCGMMASELGLDVKLARRAALMHDIGKALTHEIDGSHAVIGADLARKLGEDEVVANAIGAHHTDEPWGSAYALLVAASDAMSGARPGARRQQDDNYGERIADLERLTQGRPGVDRVYVVHGGREVRIHVREDRISDARAVELSSEMAKQISDELTFPGQIKVTVIREVRAISVAS